MQDVFLLAKLFLQKHRAFFVLKDATAWQIMKYVKTLMVLPAKVTRKKATRSEKALELLNCLMFDASSSTEIEVLACLRSRARSRDLALQCLGMIGI